MISIFKQRFIIVGADLYVYRYMMANNDKFPPEIIENLRNYMFNKGYLKYDVDDKMKEIVESENKWDEDAGKYWSILYIISFLKLFEFYRSSGKTEGR